MMPKKINDQQTKQDSVILPCTERSWSCPKVEAVR